MKTEHIISSVGENYHEYLFTADSSSLKIGIIYPADFKKIPFGEN